MTRKTRNARTRRMAADISANSNSTALPMLACGRVGSFRSRGQVLFGAPERTLPHARRAGRRRELLERRVAAPGRRRRGRARAGGRALFEKAGVNWSSVDGELPAELADHMPGEGRAFRACGISLVLHPRSPMVPTTH